MIPVTGSSAGSQPIACGIGSRGSRQPLDGATSVPRVWRKAAKQDLVSQLVVHELSGRQPLQILVFDPLRVLISDRMMQRVNRLQ